RDRSGHGGSRRELRHRHRDRVDRSKGAIQVSAELILEMPDVKPGMLRRTWRTLRQAGGVQMGMLSSGVIIVALFTLLAVLAPWISPYGFNVNSADGVSFPTQAPPGAGHLFGTTTGFGADVLSQVIYGSRTALEVVVLSVVLAVLVGVPL